MRLVCTLLRGSPLVVSVEEGTLPAVNAVRWERTLLRGCLFLYLRPLAPGEPPLPLGHAVCWESTHPYGGGSPLSYGLGPRAKGARGPSPAP